MNTKINHIYIGNVDCLPQWAGISTEEDVEGGELSDDNLHKVVGKVRGVRGKTLCITHRFSVV